MSIATVPVVPTITVVPVVQNHNHWDSYTPCSRKDPMFSKFPLVPVSKGIQSPNCPNVPAATPVFPTVKSDP